MEREQIRLVIKKKVDQLSAASKIIDKEFDKEAIHTFRVTIKSLRSFLRLLNTGGQKKLLKIPEKIKRLYHIAGAVREAQLEMEMIAEKQAALPHYCNKLHLVLERQKKEWGRHYSKKSVQKSEDSLTDYPYQALDEKTFGLFFKLRMESIDELGKKKPPTDNEIHSIRKLAKDILYTVKLAKKKCSGVKDLISEIPVKQLDSLAAEIGDYNDKRITLEHLSSFSSRNITKEEVANIKALCDRYANELKARKRRIVMGVRKLKFAQSTI
jgi:CHAD domain-containing protein